MCYSPAALLSRMAGKMKVAHRCSPVCIRRLCVELLELRSLIQVMNSLRLLSGLVWRDCDLLASRNPGNMGRKDKSLVVMSSLRKLLCKPSVCTEGEGESSWPLKVKNFSSWGLSPETLLRIYLEFYCWPMTTEILCWGAPSSKTVHFLYT